MILSCISPLIPAHYHFVYSVISILFHSSCHYRSKKLLRILRLRISPSVHLANSGESTLQEKGILPWEVCVVNDKEFFCHFLIIHDESRCKFEPLGVYGHLKSMNASDITNGVHRSPEIVIKWFGLFYKYLKIYKKDTAYI